MLKYNCIHPFRFKDGHEIHEDARIKISRDTQRIENYYLTLNLARTEDAGTYEMKATNFIGETTSTCKVAVLSEYSCGLEHWQDLNYRLKDIEGGWDIRREKSITKTITI